MIIRIEYNLYNIDFLFKNLNISKILGYYFKYFELKRIVLF